MAVALDTNIVRLLLEGAEPAASILAPLIDAYNAQEGLVLCGPVYAELLAAPGATIAALDEFLTDTGIAVDFVLAPSIWQNAGVAFQAYGARRLAAQSTWPRRILADFLIGAHALHTATALMTLNRDDFARLFPALPLIVPSIVPPTSTGAAP